MRGGTTVDPEVVGHGVRVRAGIHTEGSHGSEYEPTTIYAEVIRTGQLKREWTRIDRENVEFEKIST